MVLLGMSISSPVTPDGVLLLPCVDDLGARVDADLMGLQREIAAVEREAHSRAARVAAEIARRSSPDLGHAGLAAREGMRSSVQLIEKLAGVTPEEARAMVRVGEVLTTGGEGHTALVAEAVGAGSVSVRAADAIITGLGETTDTVTVEALEGAAVRLLDIVPDTRVARIGAQARALRDCL